MTKYKRLAQDEKGAPGATDGGYSERFQSEKGMGGWYRGGMHGTLPEVGELPVGPELNGFGRVQEGERESRDAPGLPSSVSHPCRFHMNLAEQHVPGSKNAYYIPDFVTTDEETYLLRKVSWKNLPQPTPSASHYTQILETPQPKWKQLSNRRYVVLSFFVPAN
jgi:hypothetical protein